MEEGSTLLQALECGFYSTKFAREQFHSRVLDDTCFSKQGPLRKLWSTTGQNRTDLRQFQLQPGIVRTTKYTRNNVRLCLDTVLRMRKVGQGLGQTPESSTRKLKRG